MAYCRMKPRCGAYVSVSSDGYARTVERAADPLNSAGIDVNRAVIFPDATPNLSKNGLLGLSRR